MKTRVSARLVKPNPAESCREAAGRGCRSALTPWTLLFEVHVLILSKYDFLWIINGGRRFFYRAENAADVFVRVKVFSFFWVLLVLVSGLFVRWTNAEARTELSLRDNPWSCEATLGSERAVFSCHCFHPGGREHDSEVSTCGTSRRAHTWKVVLVIFSFTSGPLCWRPKSLRPASRSGPGSCRWGAAPPSWSGPPGGGCPGWRTSKCPSGSFVFTRNKKEDE